LKREYTGYANIYFLLEKRSLNANINLYGKIPIGPWAKDPTLKELGRLELTHMHMAVDSHTLALFTRALNYSRDRADVLMEGVKSEFRNRDLRLITSYRFIIGRKPLDS
jgi:hypothetical protein